MLPLSFLRTHWPLLMYGWLMKLTSGFGQTYFISIYGGAIRADFGLDHAAYGAAYSMGTLVSGCLLLWFGRFIDRTPLWLFSLLAIGGLAFGTLFIGFAEGATGLMLAFLILRFFGQGLMTHAAMTTMGRYFSAERGRAIAFALTGHVAGGIAFPLMGAALLAFAPWRYIWWAGGAVLVVLVAPLILSLLAMRRASEPPQIAATPSGGMHQSRPTLTPAVVHRQWTLGEAVRDARLYVYLAVLLAPSFVSTGFIFHQVHIGSQYGWSLGIIASALSVYAVCSFVTTLLAGRLVDYFSARALMSLALVPLILACLLLTFETSTFGAVGFFVLLGLGSGITTVLMGAIWPEAYGTRHLGTIRSLAASGSVFASALAPGLFGVLFDQSWSAADIAVLCAAYAVAASILAYLMVDFHRPAV